MSFVLGRFRVELPQLRAVGPGGVVPLTALEARLLEYLAERRGEAVDEPELLRNVWGYHPSVRSKAVQLLVSRLRRKLGDEPPTLILTGPRGGYALARPLDEQLDPAELRRAVRHLGRDPQALARLEALLPAEGTPLSPELAARVEIGRSAVAVARQLHRDATALRAHAAASTGALAVECAIWAARLAAATGDPADAVRELRPWLDRLPEGHPETEADLLATLANQAIQGLALEEARGYAGRLHALGMRSGDPRARGLALAVEGRVGALGGEPPSLVEANFRDAATVLRVAGELLEAAAVEANLGGWYHQSDQSDRAIPLLRRAGATLRAAGRELDAALCETSLGTALLATAATDEALSLAEAARVAFEAHADGPGEANAQLLRGRILATLGDVAGAEVSLRRAATLAGRHQRPRIAAYATRYAGWCAHYRGALDQAEQDYAALVPPGDMRTGAYTALWRAWLRGDGATELAALRALLGRDPLDSQAGRTRVDALLSARLLANLRAPAPP